MEPRLREAIAKIEIRNGGEVTSRGTGTLVAEGLVLTALHVVGDRRSDPVRFMPGEIVLTFPGHTTRATPVEGMCHGGLDWALLRCEENPTVRPVPLGELRESGGAWTTYGFPDAQPIDGMVQAGTVRNVEARLNGQPTYQLFSEEASAGQGAPVKGLSGGPVLVDGALVGVLRFALMREGQAVAGTLYACPTRIAVEACDGLLPIPDPCRGLPGLPRRPLPEHPFRFLSRYREEDAEIFFGRNQDVRAVFEQVTAEDGVGVVLFYGQTGVGKSSFLDAGLVPRLRWTHNVRYLRREQGRSLLMTLRDGLVAESEDGAADDHTPLGRLWQLAEEHGGRPVVVILDQVEEVYTRRDDARSDEMSELGRALHDVLHGELEAPRGQLVLGFRKEWYPEVQQRLEECGVEFSRVFLETLRKDGVAEAVSGLTHTQRLRERYGLTVAPELPTVIAGQLHEDPDSPIAPTLQILLAKMWQTACADNAHAPAFTLDLYTRLKHEGALLGDFLDQQIDAMSERRPSAVSSGLVLDVLAHHTTPLLTADECSGAELATDFGHHEEFEGLLVDMQELYLLVDAGKDSAGGGSRSRLAHDTLAPLVRQRYDESARPGQAASRILQSRVPAGATADEIAPLDDHDLATVEAGLPGMRALLPLERSLVDESCADRALRRRRKRRNRAIFVTMLVVLAITSVVALNELRAADRGREINVLAKSTDKVRSDLVSNPADGLTVAFCAVCRSIEREYPIANELKMSLSTALEGAREVHEHEFPDEVNCVAAHPSAPRYAVALENGEIHVRTRGGREVRSPLHCFDLDATYGNKQVDGHDPRAARRVAYSPNGHWLYAAGNDGRLRGWQPAVPGSSVCTAEHGSAIRSLAVSPDGTYVATGGADGTIRLWNEDATSTECSLRDDDLVGGVNDLAFTESGLLVAGSDDGVVRIWSIDAPESPVQEIREHEGPVLTVATVDSVALGPLIASGGADETVRIFDENGCPVVTRNWRKDAEPEHAAGVNERDVVIADHQSAVRAIAFDGDGSYLLSGDEMGVVLLNDVLGEPGAHPFLGPDDAVRSISYYFDGVALIASLDHTVRSRSRHGLLVTSDLRPLGEVVNQSDPELLCVAFSDDGDLVAAGDDSGAVTVWDHASLQILDRWETVGTTPVGVVLAGTGIVVAACTDGSLRVFERGHAPWPPRQLGAALTALAADRDGHVAIGAEDGSVRVFELKRGTKSQTVSASGAPVIAIALSREEHRLAVSRANSELGVADSRVELWERSGTWEFRRELLSDSSHVEIYGLAFGNSGDILYTAGADGQLRIRDFTTGKRLHAPQKAHLGPANSVAASSDGTRVVTGGTDGRLVLWGIDLPEKRGFSLWELLDRTDDKVKVDRIAEFVPAHRWGVNAVAFGGEGERLAASASADGSLRLWRAHHELWLEAAATRLGERLARLDGDDASDQPATTDVRDESDGIAPRRAAALSDATSELPGRVEDDRVNDELDEAEAEQKKRLRRYLEKPPWKSDE